MDESNRDIVVIGASAGGVEALRTLLASLPADLPAAIFIVLHLWPGGTSFLPEILGRATAFKARHAADGEPIERGHVYIAPPDLHLFVNRGSVAVLKGPRENRCRPAINPLFRSAAVAYGPRVIGVVLTGTLDDGAAGMWTIKQAGGKALVQHPADVAFPDMPQNTLDTVQVDHCVPLAQIGGVLNRLCRERIQLNGMSPLPAIAQLNDAGAQMKQIEMQIDNLAKRSVFTCPECNGALWEVEEGGQLSFRCHVGHGYSAKVLREEQSGVLEQSLWSALRALVESAAMDERLAARAEEHNLGKAAETYRASARQKQDHEKELRAFLNGLGTPRVPAELSTG